MASSVKEFDGCRYAKWTNPDPKNIYFTAGLIYPIISTYNNEMVVMDNTEEKAFVEDDQIQWFQPITDAEYKQSRNQMGGMQRSSQDENVVRHNPNRPNIAADDKAFSTQLDLNENQFPYWANYVIINNDGVWATTSSPDEVSTMKEKVTLANPIVIQIPQKQKPFEILANLFKEGKITYAELEAELKTLFK